MTTVPSYYEDIQVIPAENVPFHTPAQVPASGVAVSDGSTVHKLFQPIKIRGVEFHNRIFLSPLCQYSCKDGIAGPWHMAHLGGIISRGPGLAIVEATAVVPEGRITPDDLGLWSDEHLNALKPIVDFAHSQNQKIGIQIAHAGRKASTTAPWLGSHLASNNVGGWPDDVVGQSDVPWDTSGRYPQPKALTVPQIKDVVRAFVDAALRAVKTGFDVIEIHNAHGFLLHNFISPYSNKRTDQYGGSFENRIRLTLEVVDAVRAVIPDTMPLFLRISASDVIEHLPNTPSWRSEDTVRLAPILAEHGVDFLDVSSGGNAPEQDIASLKVVPAYQALFAEAVKKATGNKMIVGVVGGIRSGAIAAEVLDKGQADVVICGRWFQKNPALVWEFAEHLGVEVRVTRQIEWAFAGKDRTEKKK